MRMKHVVIGLITLAVLVVVGIVSWNAARSTDGFDQEVQEISEDSTQIKEEDTESSSDFVDGSYVLDVVTSRIFWTGRNPVLGLNQSGHFELSRGDFNVSGGEIISGEFTIDMQSLTADVGGVENHLRSGDFFAVDTHPEAHFVITSVDGSMITGDLTIKGVTHPVVFSADIVSGSGIMLATTEPFTIDRTDWGVTFGSDTFFDNLGDAVVDDVVTLKLDLRSSLIEN